MEAKKLPRRNAIPILYTRGTHYDVGFDVGRTFAAIIRNFLQLYKPLNKEYLALYDTPEGKEVYNETLEAVKKSFPQYIRELEGIADGAQVEFHKLFLIHLDEILPNSVSQKRVNKIDEPIIISNGRTLSSNGCSTIIVNSPDCEVIGHTEDALGETLNHFYYVDAHIISDTPQGKHKVNEEHFFSLCYAGSLPGYTMNYNYHGLVFTINTISADKLRSGKIPRVFLTRALLAAKNYEEAEAVLRDVGVGAADGCTVNMTFVKGDSEKIFYNIEMGPAREGEHESQLNVKKVDKGSHNYHCNKYLRLVFPENNPYMIESSDIRMKTLCGYEPPKQKDDVVQMLGDPNGLFRENGDVNEFVKTIATGIFDLQKKVLMIYSDSPRESKPLIVLPLNFEEPTQ